MKKTLATLIKLQKTYVDEQRQQLARLQTALESIEQRIAEHQIEVAREQVAAEETPEARTTYGAFIRKMIENGKMLEEERRTIEQAVELARLRLGELFEEQKRYEIAEEARLAEEAREAARRDRMAMDEVGMVGFVRKKDE